MDHINIVSFLSQVQWRRDYSGDGFPGLNGDYRILAEQRPVPALNIKGKVHVATKSWNGKQV